MNDIAGARTPPLFCISITILRPLKFNTEGL
jgi:hypothetical protein